MGQPRRPNREVRPTLPASGGRKLGSRGTVKATESSIKSVIDELLKMLRSSDQKVSVQVWELLTLLTRMA